MEVSIEILPADLAAQLPAGTLAFTTAVSLWLQTLVVFSKAYIKHAVICLFLSAIRPGFGRSDPNANPYLPPPEGRVNWVR